MGEPAISVLLPVYNAEPYIREAVESVLSQTFTDFEFLILDDGSTDQSPEILRAYEAQDARIKVLTRENRGIVASLNELIDLASGQFIARMDADDICRPERLATQIPYLIHHPDCVAVGAAALVIDSDGLPICRFGAELTHDQIDTAHLSAVGESRICHPSVAMRRAAVLNAGAYRREYQYAEDLDLFLRLAEVGQIVNLPDVLLEYRHHFGSMCYAKGDNGHKVGRQAVDEARRRRGMAPLTERYSPPVKSETEADLRRKWAWWALMSGNVRTSRKYAFKAFMANPLNIESAKLLACALRGR